MAGRLLLIWRLALKDLRHRPAQAFLLLLAIAAGAATLTLGLALHGTTRQPVRQDEGGDQRAGRGRDRPPGRLERFRPGHHRQPGRVPCPRTGPGRLADSASTGTRRGRAQRALPRHLDPVPDRPQHRGRRDRRPGFGPVSGRPTQTAARHLGPTRRGRRGGGFRERAGSARRRPADLRRRLPARRGHGRDRRHPLLPGRLLPRRGLLPGERSFRRQPGPDLDHPNRRGPHRGSHLRTGGLLSEPQTRRPGLGPRVRRPSQRERLAD